MRKFALILCILIAFSACAMGSASASAEELTVFNWFDYICLLYTSDAADE